MASNNRATLINKVIKVVKKHFQPAAPPKDRTVLEHLLVACCLENSPHDAAEKVFEALSRDFFDWNEVRVTSLRELGEVMKSLNDAQASATRLKRVLQSVFETHYSFDLEPLKKQNIGQAVKQLEQYHGTTPFTIAYATQNALGGHAIAVDQGLLTCMQVVGVISDAEAARGVVPGLERAVPKTKGVEIGSLLHQLGVEMYRSPYGPTIRKLLLEINPQCKDRLPKRPSKKKAEPAVTPSATGKKAKPQETAASPPKAPAAKSKPAAKKATKESAAKETRRAVGKSKSAKKTTKKKVVKKKKKAAASTTKKKKSTTKGKKASATKRLTKRKPR